MRIAKPQSLSPWIDTGAWGFSPQSSKLKPLLSLHAAGAGKWDVLHLLPVNEGTHERGGCLGWDRCQRCRGADGMLGVFRSFGWTVRYEPLPEWDNRAPSFPNPRRGKAAASPLLSLLLHVSCPTLRIPILVKGNVFQKQFQNSFSSFGFVFLIIKLAVCVHTETWTQMFIVALFIIAQTCKQPTWPSTEKQKNKMQDFHAMASSPMAKRHIFLRIHDIHVILTTTWICLKSIKWKKPDAKGHILFDSFYMKLPKKANLCTQQDQRGWGWRWEWQFTANGMNDHFGVMEMSQNWIVVMIAQLYEGIKDFWGRMPWLTLAIPTL